MPRGGSAAQSMGASRQGMSGMSLSRGRRERRTMGAWTAGGCASRRSARSGSRHWSTSSSCAGSSTADVGPRPRLAAARCAAAVRVRHVAAHGVDVAHRPAHRARRRPRCSSARRTRPSCSTNLEIIARAVVPARQRARPDRRCGRDLGAAQSCSRPSPTASPSIGGSGSRSSFLWTPVLVGSAHAAHDAARRDVAVHRHQRRGDPQPVRRAVARVGGTRGASTSSSSRGRPSRSALAVLGSRALFGDPEVRARTRVMALTVACGDAWPSCCGRSCPGIWGVEFLVYASMIAHPGRGDPRHPPVRRVRHRAGRSRRASSSARRTCSSRWSTRPASRRPRVLLADRLSTVPAILLTTLARGRAAAGAQLDAAVDPPRPLRRPRAAVHDAERARRATRTGRRPARAAHAARRGGARRARRVVGAHPAGVDGWRARRGARSGSRGDVAGEPVESCDLVRGDEIARPHRGRTAAPRRVQRRRADAAAHGRRPGRGIRRQRAPDGAARRAARRADAPRASGSSPRRTTSAAASSATCTTASSRTSWRRSPGSASPAIDCSAGELTPGGARRAAGPGP